MVYATTDALCGRWPLELAGRDEAQLTQALEAAGAEIDSYRPPGPLGEAALAILAEHSLILARLALQPDINLEAGHPIVREARRVREWLAQLARGLVRLPADSPAASGAAPRAGAPAEVFGADFITRHGS